MKKRINIIIKLLFLFPLFLYSNNENKQEADKFIVVLDAGHGGKDPGALGKIGTEKDIALDITLKLGEYIEAHVENVEVIYTRKTDVFVPLQERADIANKIKAHLFLSIHVNANDNPAPYGTSSHILGLHRTQENFEIAKKENSVILLEDDYQTRYKNFDPNSPESYIIFSVMQNVYQNQSIEMAAMIQDQFRERVNRKDRGVERQGLLVLAQSSMPGVLIETGFITNPKEEAFLMSEMGQDYMASAIYRAFKGYLYNIRSKSNFTGYNNAKPVDEKKNKLQKNINIVSPQEFSETEMKEEDSHDHGHTVEVKKNVSENGNVEVLQANSVITENDTLVLFRIQISSSYALLDGNSGFFQGIENVEYYETDGLYKYVTGKDSSYETIRSKLDGVRNVFPDAFIIAVKKGKIISLQQAFQETSLKNNNIN